MRRRSKVISVHNMFDGISPELPGEAVEEILRAETFRIERIVSRGQNSPEGFWYDQETEEWVLLVSGNATLGFDDGRKVDLKPGDHLSIPRHVRHRVERTDPGQETVWLAVHWTRGS
ncbi:MAG: cupin domain-containing protein [Deltaproteobacteria bacterium]|nr:MAG: cupin domain-containing protein [Deltaproteobacteria bacterium]